MKINFWDYDLEYDHGYVFYLFYISQDSIKKYLYGGELKTRQGAFSISKPQKTSIIRICQKNLG